MQGRKWESEDARRNAQREAQRRYREKHRDRVRAAQRAYIERHPERRAATLKAAWARLRVDPVRYARFLQQGRESYARHPETAYLYALNWRGTNRENLRARNRRYSRERWARVRSAAQAEIADYARVLRLDPCSYCGQPGGVIDHVDALAVGGEHAAGNLTAACRSCNARKRIKPMLLFLLQQQLKRQQA